MLVPRDHVHSNGHHDPLAIVNLVLAINMQAVVHLHYLDQLAYPLNSLCLREDNAKSIQVLGVVLKG